MVMAEPGNGVQRNPERWGGTETKASEEFVGVGLDVSSIAGTWRYIYVSPLHMVDERGEGFVLDVNKALLFPCC